MPYLDPQMVYEREEQKIWDAFERGELSQEEVNAEIRELQREYRAMADEAAHDAYQNEMDRW